MLLQAVPQRPEAPTVGFAPSQAPAKATPAATASSGPSSGLASDTVSSRSAEAARAAPAQGSTVQEPQGLQVNSLPALTVLCYTLAGFARHHSACWEPLDMGKR